MSSQFGLTPETIHSIQSVLASFPEIETAILYGSRAKGNYKNGSDIDLTFKTQKQIILPIIQIGVALDEIDLPYTFDISTYEKIQNPDLTSHINRVGVVFYQKPLRNGYTISYLDDE